MASSIKYLCRCGSHVEKIYSYYPLPINGGHKITVCDNCAMMYGLTDETKYKKVQYFKESDKNKS